MKRPETAGPRDVFKQDESNAGLYDLVISLNQIEEGEAVKMILETAALRQFEPMTYSLNCVKEFLLAAQVKARLVERFPDSRVRVDGENTVIHIQALKRNAKKYSAVAKEMARSVPGVKHVEVAHYYGFYRTSRGKQPLDYFLQTGVCHV